tara:strand:- start:680 stop:919 length:240 start_codon:yes stop_codon:yes gene_type:complete
MKKKILVLGSTGLLGTSLETVIKKDQNFKYIGCSHSDIDINNKKKLEKILKNHAFLHFLLSKFYMMALSPYAGVIISQQ